jgi:hypothetical protein
MNKLPIIFILDMDKSIIGDGIYINELYHILNKNFENCENKKRDLWKKNISPYFIRPYFKEFLINIKKNFNNVDFFIFSAGSKLYVEYMIEYIEETINFKFNRPLFTRDNLMNTINKNYSIKEIEGFTDIIIKSKYSPAEKEIIINNRLIIIDDIIEFWNNNHVIKCNPYLYKPIPYLDYSFLNEMRINEKILQYINNANFISMPKNLSSTSYDEFFFNYHLYISELSRKTIKINNEAIKDDFFRKLFNLLIPRLKLKKPFTSKYIAIINKKMII